MASENVPNSSNGPLQVLIQGRRDLCGHDVPGALGSVGGNIPLKGYGTGPSRQEPGEESYSVSPRKIYSPSR